MKTLVTENLKIELAKQIYNSLDLSFNNFVSLENANYWFAVLGRQLEWPDPENIPQPTQGVSCLNRLYRSGLFARRLSNSNAAFVTRRIDWKTGTVYDAFSDFQCVFTFNLNFYVLTSNFQVFKCLDNNGGVPSTSEPSITLSTTSLEEPFIKTGDGYRWKYLYTLSSIQRQKFLTIDFMPVSVNKFVSASAINGSIDLVRIINSGNNYISGTLQNIITVEGDGTGAAFRANVSSGQITDVIIQNRGQNYTQADLFVQDVEGGIGSGAELEVVISPQNGHGFDPVYELGASTLMFDCDFPGDDNDFLSENDYRQVFILKNPIDNRTNSLAIDEKYNLYFRIKTSPGIGDFNEDELVFQGTTFEDATFTADVIYFDQVQNFLYLNNIKGNIQTNESIKGFETGSIRIVNAFDSPTMKLFSGKVLYISNTEFVSRNDNQTDRIRFILKFDSNEE